MCFILTIQADCMVIMLMMSTLDRFTSTCKRVQKNKKQGVRFNLIVAVR